MSACSWAGTDLLCGTLAKQAGPLRLGVVLQGAGVLLLGLLALALGWLWPSSLPHGLMLLPFALSSLLLGAIYALACVSSYAALGRGPLALVSPLLAAQGAVSLLLAVLLGQQRLAGEQVMVLLTLLGGIVLAALPHHRASGSGQGGGSLLAVGAMVLWGVLGAGVGLVSSGSGAIRGLWLIIGYRVTAWLLTALVWWLWGRKQREEAPGRAWSGRDRGLLMGAAACETGGLALFALASSLIHPGIAGVLSSSAPVLVELWGLLWHKERLALQQQAGILLVLGSTLGLALPERGWILSAAGGLPGLLLMGRAWLAGQRRQQFPRQPSPAGAGTSPAVASGRDAGRKSRGPQQQTPILLCRRAQQRVGRQREGARGRQGCDHDSTRETASQLE